MNHNSPSLIFQFHNFSSKKNDISNFNIYISISTLYLCINVKMSESCLDFSERQDRRDIKCIVLFVCFLWKKIAATGVYTQIGITAQHSTVGILTAILKEMIPTQNCSLFR